MDTVRTAVRGIPTQLSIPILRSVLKAPAPLARIMMNELTEPLNRHLPYIRKVYNGSWNGAWIGEGMKELDQYEDIKARVRSADVVIFNVHGGPFRVGTSTMFMNAYVAWIKILKEKYNLNAIIMSVKYRLAPEHKYPAATEDVLTAYKYLRRSLKIPHDKIVVTGDSAGAALLLEAMLQTHAPELLPANTASTANAEIETVTSSVGDRELPAAMLLVSPVVCSETTTPSWKENAKYDMIRPKLFKKVFKEFFGTKDPSFKDVRLIAMTKMQTGFDQFIPKNTMMVVGSKEVMRDDITEMSLRVIKNTNIKGHLVSEDYAHDWYVIRDTVKDKTAIQRTDAIFAEFVASALKEAQTPNPFDDRLAVDENAPKTVNNDLPVKFTRNGVTMRFSRNSMQELLGNLDQVDTSKDGIAKTLDSMAKMTAGLSGSNSQSGLNSEQQSTQQSTQQNAQPTPTSTPQYVTV
ncbi:unnamed protein product [Umbelopsis ramanniana]